MKNTTVKNYITENLDTLSKTDPEETVGSALNKVTSTHEPVLVFEDDAFKGLIYTAHSLFRKKHFYMSKVKSCLLVPPYLNPDTPLYKVAEHMIMTRLYTLPVFNKKKELIGVVHLDDILEDLIKDKEMYSTIEPNISVRKPITMDSQSTINDVYKTMKREKISRVIITDKTDNLKGIVSRKDLESAFVSETPRQRFGSRMRGLHYVSYFDEEPMKREDEPITAYYNTSVLTVEQGNTPKQILKKMIQNDRNSAVVVKKRRPVGFISRSDFVQALAQTRPEREIPILVPDPKDDLSVSERFRILETMYTFAQKINKRKPLQRVELNFKTAKNAVGDINEYEFTLQIFAKDGDKIIANEKNRDIDLAIHELMKEIEAQLRSRN